MTRRFFAAASICLAITACSKSGSNIEPVQDQCSLTVRDNFGPWGKSAYEDGKGISLSGKEEIALFHRNGDTFEGISGNTTHAIKATPTSTRGSYYFSRNGYGNSGWYSVMPYHDDFVRLQDNGSRVLLRLSPIQFPAKDSFDPRFDFLLGKPFDMEGNSGEINSFKRLFAPLEVKIQGIETEKLVSLSLSFDKSVPYNTTSVADGLAGAFYTRFSEDYGQAQTANLATGSVSNAVTALFPDGVNAQTDGHHVWFMVNLCSFAAGTKVCVTATTASHRYFKEISLPSAISTEAERINKISFDLASAESSDIDNVWYPTPVRMTSGSSLTIPPIPGKKIKGLRIYSDPQSYGSTNDDAYISLKNTSGNAIASYRFNHYASSASSSSLNMSGGILDISLPSGYETLAGMTLASSDSRSKYISGMTLLTEGEGIVPGELKADGNDVSTYELIAGCGYNYECPDNSGAHSSSPFRHITQSWDETLGKYVFNFILHIDNDDDRGLANVKDRQRNEIKTDNGSPKSMVAQEGETLRMSWKFRLPTGMKTTSNFSHIHQLKGIDNQAETADVSNPLITYTVRTKSDRQVFQVIYRAPGDSQNEYLCSDVDLKEFLGQWVSVTETVTFSREGSYSTVIKRLSDGRTLLTLSGIKRDLRRDGARGMRPKWGLYRYFGNNRSLASELRDETLQFADFKIEKL